MLKEGDIIASYCGYSRIAWASEDAVRIHSVLDESRFATLIPQSLVKDRNPETFASVRAILNQRTDETRKLEGALKRATKPETISRIKRRLDNLNRVMPATIQAANILMWGDQASDSNL